MTQNGTSTAFLAQPRYNACVFLLNQRLTSGQEQRVGNSPRLRLGIRIIGENSLFTLKKNKGIQAFFPPRKAAHSYQHYGLPCIPIHKWPISELSFVFMSLPK
jgi:hypothetical protein